MPDQPDDASTPSPASDEDPPPKATSERVRLEVDILRDAHPEVEPTGDASPDAETNPADADGSDAPPDRTPGGAGPLCVMLLMLCLAGMPGLARAQIYVDADATGAGDGTSWTDAYTDLQAAIDNATGSDELWIAAGVYTPAREDTSFTITGAIDGVELYGGFAGTETARTQRDPEQHRTILSGDLNRDDLDPNGDGIIENEADLQGGENAHHVLILDGGDWIGPDVDANITSATIIDGVVVTAGQADKPSSSTGEDGGGLYCDGVGSGNACSPTLRQIIFAGNVALDNGGAIYNGGFNGGTASPTITDAVFTGNQTQGRGGAIRNAGFSVGTASPHITHSTFTNNAAQDGGAIHSSSANGTSSPRITNTVFTVNTATRWGGVLYVSTDGTTRPEIARTVFAHNSAGSKGGAIYSRGGESTAPYTITNTLFIGNATSGDGGAMYIYADFDDTASPTIANAVFIDNTAQGDGGAIYNLQGSSGTVQPHIVNTILWGNSAAASGSAIYNQGAMPTLTATLVEGGVNGTGVEGSANTDGGGNLDAAPLFVNASDPDGPDDVFATVDDGLALQAASPAIDAGNNAAVPSGMTTDFTGAARIVAAGSGVPRVDIGAYEYRRIGVALTSGGFGGLGRMFSAEPGQADQPVGVVRLTPAQEGATLTEVVVTPNATGATGVDAATLWISSDDAFNANDDTQLARIDLDPEAPLSSALAFGGFSAALPAQAQYLFVTVTLTEGATGTLTGYLARDADLALGDGQVTSVNGNTQTGFSTLPLSEAASPLPVELTAFTAQQDGETVRLAWTTASETNNAGFEVQRRRSGNEDADAWDRLSFVDGAGTTSAARSYRYVDGDLPDGAETLTYRLRQVDTDGTSTVSEAVEVTRAAPTELQLQAPYPNPSRSRATVRFTVPEGTLRADAQLHLYDVLGRQVRTVLQMVAEPGWNELRLDTTPLASGLYLLRLTVGDETRTRRLTVVQ